MLTKKKVIFAINMQKFITSNIRHLQTKKKKNHTPTVHTRGRVFASMIIKFKCYYVHNFFFLFRRLLLAFIDAL